MIECGYQFEAQGRFVTRHVCAASFEHYTDFVTHVRNGQHVCVCGMGVQEVTDEPDEGPEDAEPDEESLGIIVAAELTLDILGLWIGWEGWEGTARNEIQTFRAGKLESVNVPKYDNGNGVQIVVSGTAYSVPRYTRFVWKRP